MEIDHTELSSLLARAYGVIAARITPAPRGFAGETYRVEPQDGPPLFVKLVPDRPGYAAPDIALPTLDTLHRLGVTGVSRPLRAADGQWSVRLEGRTLVVFAHVAGVAGTVRDWSMHPDTLSYDLDRLGTLLAQVHAATPDLPPGPPTEDFTLPFVADYERLVHNGATAPAMTPALAAARSLLDGYREQMADDWRTLGSLVDRCQRVSWTPRLTHGDALGDNVLIGEAGGLTLVDWDTALLAPAERDAWFYLNTSAAAAVFLHAYQRVIPGYQPDPHVHHYYLLRRFFEDLTDYLRLVAEHPDPDRQRWAVDEARAVCFGWLWPAVRRLDHTAG